MWQTESRNPLICQPKWDPSCTPATQRSRALPGESWGSSVPLSLTAKGSRMHPVEGCELLVSLLTPRQLQETQRLSSRRALTIVAWSRLVAARCTSSKSPELRNLSSRWRRRYYLPLQLHRCTCQSEYRRSCWSLASKKDDTLSTGWRISSLVHSDSICRHSTHSHSRRYKKLSYRWQTARRIWCNGVADLKKHAPPHMWYHAEFGVR